MPPDNLHDQSAIATISELISTSMSLWKQCFDSIGQGMEGNSPAGTSQMPTQGPVDATAKASDNPRTSKGGTSSSHRASTEKGPQEKRAKGDPFSDFMGQCQTQWYALFCSLDRVYGFGASSDGPFDPERYGPSFEAFQLAFLEFANILSRPVKEKVYEFSANMRPDGAPEKLCREDLYHQLMQMLEEGYAELFCSGEFVESLKKVIHAAGETSQARNDLLNDAMKSLSMPTKEDYDKLLKAFHELKRQVRDLSQRINLDDGSM